MSGIEVEAFFTTEAINRRRLAFRARIQQVEQDLQSRLDRLSHEHVKLLKALRVDDIEHPVEQITASLLQNAIRDAFADLVSLTPDVDMAETWEREALLRRLALLREQVRMLKEELSRLQIGYNSLSSKHSKLMTYCRTLQTTMWSSLNTAVEQLQQRGEGQSAVQLLQLFNSSDWSSVGDSHDSLAAQFSRLNDRTSKAVSTSEDADDVVKQLIAHAVAECRAEEQAKQHVIEGQLRELELSMPTRISEAIRAAQAAAQNDAMLYQRLKGEYEQRIDELSDLVEIIRGDGEKKHDDVQNLLTRFITNKTEVVGGSIITMKFSGQADKALAEAMAKVEELKVELLRQKMDNKVEQQALHRTLKVANQRLGKVRPEEEIAAEARAPLLAEIDTLKRQVVLVNERVDAVVKDARSHQAVLDAKIDEQMRSIAHTTNLLKDSQRENETLTTTVEQQRDTIYALQNQLSNAIREGLAFSDSDGAVGNVAASAPASGGGTTRSGSRGGSVGDHFGSGAQQLGEPPGHRRNTAVGMTPPLRSKSLLSVGGSGNSHRSSMVSSTVDDWDTHGDNANQSNMLQSSNKNSGGSGPRTPSRSKSINLSADVGGDTPPSGMNHTQKPSSSSTHTSERQGSFMTLAAVGNGSGDDVVGQNFSLAEAEQQQQGGGAAQPKNDGVPSSIRVGVSSGTGNTHHRGDQVLRNMVCAAQVSGRVPAGAGGGGNLIITGGGGGAGKSLLLLSPTKPKKSSSLRSMELVKALLDVAAMHLAMPLASSSTTSNHDHTPWSHDALVVQPSRPRTDAGTMVDATTQTLPFSRLSSAGPAFRGGGTNTAREEEFSSVTLTLTGGGPPPQASHNHQRKPQRPTSGRSFPRDQRLPTVAKVHGVSVRELSLLPERLLIAASTGDSSRLYQHHNNTTPDDGLVV